MSAGVRVPHDIAVVGYDNNRAAWGSAVPITTLAQPGEEMGRAAARLLPDEIRAPKTHSHEHIVLPPELIVRESSRL